MEWAPQRAGPPRTSGPKIQNETAAFKMKGAYFTGVHGRSQSPGALLALSANKGVAAHATHRCSLNRVHTRADVRHIRVRLPQRPHINVPVALGTMASRTSETMANGNIEMGKPSSATTPSATSSCGPMCCGCTKSLRRSPRRPRWRWASRSTSRPCRGKSSPRCRPGRLT